MFYSSIVENRIRQTFDHVNHHRWDEALEAVAPHVHHRVSGVHALSGERHDKEAMRRWFERFGRVQPNLQIKVNKVWVMGWPWHSQSACASRAIEPAFAARCDNPRIFQAAA
ncbi:nuclear transport factor 2 family protein [Polaromonas sp.]|uniref:nuclear transport factor 2 family protein n=1 Tax=Polaromonas sp. TaxID=1869339 RepID=UPI002FC624AC